MEGRPLNDPYYIELKKRIWKMLDGIYGIIYLASPPEYDAYPDRYESDDFKQKWKTKVGKIRIEVILTSVSRQYCGADVPQSISSPEHLLSMNICCGAFKAIQFENFYNHLTKGRCIELLTNSGLSVGTATKKLNDRIKAGYYFETYDGINKKNKYIIPTVYHFRLRSVLAFASYCDATAGMMALEELSGVSMVRQNIWTEKLGFDPDIIKFAVDEKIKEFNDAKN